MQFGNKELRILQDSEVLPLKARICRKVEEKLLDLGEVYRRTIGERSLPDYPDALHSGGKISRGENYRQQAYRVLDLPSMLSKEDMFLFRTMMLWGDAFSWHFVLTGKYLDSFGDKLLANLGSITDGGFLSLHNDPWTWHRNDPSWVALHDKLDAKAAEDLAKRKFLKISHFLDLKEYKRLEERGVEILESYLDVLG